MGGQESTDYESRKKIEDMNAQISKLQSTIAALTATQKKTTDELERQRRWQDTVTRQIGAAEESNRIRDAKLDKILNMLAPMAATMQQAGQFNTSLEGQNNLVMTVNQGGTMSHNPPPANLVSQSQHNHIGDQFTLPPDPGGGKI